MGTANHQGLRTLVFTLRWGKGDRTKGPDQIHCQKQWTQNQKPQRATLSVRTLTRKIFLQVRRPRRDLAVLTWVLGGGGDFNHKLFHKWVDGQILTTCRFSKVHTENLFKWFQVGSFPEPFIEPCINSLWKNILTNQPLKYLHKSNVNKQWLHNQKLQNTQEASILRNNNKYNRQN